MQIHYGIPQNKIKTPIVTIGSFDGVHKGHVKVLQDLVHRAQEERGESVIISFEPHPRTILYPTEEAPKILTTLDEKVARLELLGIDHLIILPFTLELSRLSYDSFIEEILVKQLHISHLIVGYDHRFGRNREGNFDTIQQLATRLSFSLDKLEVYSEDAVNISSTKIRQALFEGNIQVVTQYLGYYYPISGTVVHGKALGRTIGFPTANIAVDAENKLLPLPGVYGVKVHINGQLFDGMLNIGTRPTITSDGHTTIEVNIFSLEENLYNQEIAVTLLFRERGECKFDSIKDLQEQLHRDRSSIQSKMNKF